VKKKTLNLLLIVFALSTGITWVRVYRAFQPPSLYTKDFIQFYLMAKAAAAERPIYAPLADLAHEFDPNLGDYPQSSAYPPTVLLLCRPLAALPYFYALLLWDVVELLCFAIASILVIRRFRSQASVRALLLIVVSFMLWPPFFYDLFQGQMMMTILLLVTITWLSLASGRHTLGGISLGLLFALKLYAAPIALLLLLQRNYRSLAWAIATFLLSNTIVVVWLGTNTLTQYYLQVAPQIERTYRAHPLNFSVYALGARLVAPWFGFVIAGIILAFAFWLAWRAPDFDHAFMILVAVTTIISPVAWTHYFITLLPAFCLLITWKEIHAGEKVLIVVLFFLAIPEMYNLFTPWSVIRIIQVLFILGLMLLLSRIFKTAGDPVRSSRRIADHHTVSRREQILNLRSAPERS
jgi:hypothetical protein